MAKDDVIHVLILETAGQERKIGIRPMQISDYEQAAQAAALTNPSNQFVFGILLQKELTKLLLVSVDGKKLTGMEKENLGGVLAHEEYLAVNEYVGSLMGKSKLVRVEFQKTSGGK